MATMNLNLSYCLAFFPFYWFPSVWRQAVAKLETTLWAWLDKKPMGVSEHNLVEAQPHNRKVLDVIVTVPTATAGGE